MAATSVKRTNMVQPDDERYHNSRLSSVRNINGANPGATFFYLGKLKPGIYHLSNPLGITSAS